MFDFFFEFHLYELRLYFCDKCQMTESQFNTHFLIKETANFPSLNENDKPLK